MIKKMTNWLDTKFFNISGKIWIIIIIAVVIILVIIITLLIVYIPKSKERFMPLPGGGGISPELLNDDYSIEIAYLDSYINSCLNLNATNGSLNGTNGTMKSGSMNNGSMKNGSKKI